MSKHSGATKSDWVPAKIMQPQHKLPVLVTNGIVVLMGFYDYNGRWTSPIGNKITHWAHVPKIPGLGRLSHPRNERDSMEIANED